jgi:hypothetical protein
MRTDRFVDALASGARMSPVDPLSAMLGAWRDDVRSRPDSHVVTLAQAAAALGKTQKPRQRNRFGLTVIGAVAAAMLCLGGFGAVIYDAGPGDALYGLRTALFGESTKTRDDAVALASQQLAQVRQLVQEGKWDEAQDKLVTLSTTVQDVDDVAAQQDLVEQYNTLTVQVIERNPEATLPPPGEPLPSLPESPLTFLAPPTVEATTPSSSPSSSSSSTTTSSSSSSSPTPSSSLTSPGPSPSSTPTSTPSPTPSSSPSLTPSSSPSPTPSSSRSSTPVPTASSVPPQAPPTVAVTTTVSAPSVTVQAPPTAVPTPPAAGATPAAPTPATATPSSATSAPTAQQTAVTPATTSSQAPQATGQR